MSGVKRYIPEGYTQPASRSGTGTHMVESRDGDYVLASDYDALAQRCRDWELNHAMLRDELESERQSVAALRKERDALRAEVEQLHQQAARYERLRRLNPRQFAELHQRNLAGERFDDMVDAL